ncbi:MAG TPA: amidohydrolase family protein [Gemmatimonadaceae bacterium]
MIIDTNVFIGPYPFRHLPHPDPEVLIRVIEREGVQRAWVGHLPSAFYRDPYSGNDILYAALESHAEVLRPAPAIHPGWPGWERYLREALRRGAAAIRAYPPQWSMGPHDPAMLDLARACGEQRIPLVLTTRFEDPRQRHRLDSAGDLSGAAIRAIARADERVRVLVTSAGRGLVEEVHWGLTPAERSRVWWDISWIWGPPGDDLAHLLRTVGPDRFVYGSGWPLRLAQTPRANLALLPDDLSGVELANVADLQHE